MTPTYAYIAHVQSLRPRIADVDTDTLRLVQRDLLSMPETVQANQQLVAIGLELLARDIRELA